MPGTAGLPSMGLFSPDVHLRLSHSRINPGKTDFLHGSWVSREEGPKIESQGCVPFKSAVGGPPGAKEQGGACRF